MRLRPLQGRGPGDRVELTYDADSAYVSAKLLIIAASNATSIWSGQGDVS